MRIILQQTRKSMSVKPNSCSLQYSNNTTKQIKYSVSWHKILNFRADEVVTDIVILVPIQTAEFI
jgi:hypothetical protein